MADNQNQANPYDLPTIPDEEREKPFWLGTLPSCPRWTVGIGGVMFHRFTNPPVGFDSDAAETQRTFQKGNIELLKPSKSKAVLEMLKGKVVRFHGSTGRGSVHNITHPLYTRLAGDQPLAMHVYMVEFDETAMMLRESPRGGYPNSIYEMAGGQEKPVVPVIDKSKPEIAPGIEDLDKDDAKIFAGRRVK